MIQLLVIHTGKGLVSFSSALGVIFVLSETGKENGVVL